MKNFRKELKYFLTEAELLNVENRIKGIMKVDEHQPGDYYLIRSVYFDGIGDPCMSENEAGVGSREKYRIRAYGASDERISAEIKIRHRDTISKQSVLMDRETFDEVMAGGTTRLSTDHRLMSTTNGGPNNTSAGALPAKSAPADKWLMKIAGEHYRPKVIVEYKRSAYVYRPGDVRITVDRDVSASADFDKFFSESLHGTPILPKGTQILEIKYDEFLPEEIAMLLGGLNLERCSCSKYYLCRSGKLR